MSLKTALSHSRVLTFGVAAVMVWVLLVTVNIAGGLGTLVGNGYVGPGLTSGVAGLVVMIAFLMLGLVLYSELGEMSDEPKAWTSRSER